MKRGCARIGWLLALPVWFIVIALCYKVVEFSILNENKLAQEYTVAAVVIAIGALLIHLIMGAIGWALAGFTSDDDLEDKN